MSELRTIKLKIGYDGTEFSGWQQQADARTVQGCLEHAMEKVVGERLAIVGAARTDSGVHAVGQVASLLYRGNLPLTAFRFGLHTFLPDDLRLLDAEELPTPTDKRPFNARKDALWKIYEYHLLLSNAPHPIPNRYAWTIFEELNLEAMQKTLSHLVGTHDFSSFCAANSDAKSMERTIYEATLVCTTPSHPLFTNGRLCTIRIRGNGFLKQMIRNIVGTAMTAGRDKMPAEKMLEILAAKDRRQAGVTAPARGLFLTHIEY